MVADELGLDIAHVRVVQGDTAATPFGPGTGGSRSAVIPGTAARNAAHEVRDADGRDRGARCSKRHPTTSRSSTVGSRSSARRRKGHDDRRGRAEGVHRAGEPAARVSRSGSRRRPATRPTAFCTWANACHICVVEVDRGTGAVEILRYVVSEDCGVMINPNVVEGQIAGGVVQGIGGVLYEHLPYDEAGNPLATTFVDYLLPDGGRGPDIEYGHIETHAPTNPGGHKGLGEGGAIAAPPAVINAIADALAPLGVQVRSQPLGPADVVALDRGRVLSDELGDRVRARSSRISRSVCSEGVRRDES